MQVLDALDLFNHGRYCTQVSKGVEASYIYIRSIHPASWYLDDNPRHLGASDDSNVMQLGFLMQIGSFRAT